MQSAIGVNVPGRVHDSDLHGDGRSRKQRDVQFPCDDVRSGDSERQRRRKHIYQHADGRLHDLLRRDDNKWKGNDHEEGMHPDADAQSAGP